MPDLFVFQGDCTSFSAETIHELRFWQSALSYKEFSAAVTGLELWAKLAGYGPPGSDDLCLRDDWHVGYYESFCEELGKVYFLTWSGYEVVWARGEFCPLLEQERIELEANPPQRGWGG